MQQTKATSIKIVLLFFFNFIILKNKIKRIYFLRAVKDLIPKYMNELNAISDDLSKELISRFKTLNYMLERM